MANSICVKCSSLQTLFKRSIGLKLKNAIVPNRLYHGFNPATSTVGTGGDRHPESLVHIYYGTLTPQIKAVKVFSLTTSLAGVVAQPLIWNQAATFGSLPILVGICSFVGFFTFITPALLHFITKRYITDLEFHVRDHSYHAHTLTFFLRPKITRFHVKDVYVPDVPGMFTSFIVRDGPNKKIPLFVDPRLFSEPIHYGHIMGYDKEVDFKLAISKNKEEEKKE